MNDTEKIIAALAEIRDEIRRSHERSIEYYTEMSRRAEKLNERASNRWSGFLAAIAILMIAALFWVLSR